MHNYKKLNVWQNAIELVYEIYMVSKQFPKDELYGLTQQLRRSAVSIPSNIAEGSGRRTARDFNNFLTIAYASSFELETQLLIASKLHYIHKQEFDTICDKLILVQKRLFKLKESIDPNSI